MDQLDAYLQRPTGEPRRYDNLDTRFRRLAARCEAQTGVARATLAAAAGALLALYLAAGPCAWLVCNALTLIFPALFAYALHEDDKPLPKWLVVFGLAYVALLVLDAVLPQNGAKGLYWLCKFALLIYLQWIYPLTDDTCPSNQPDDGVKQRTRSDRKRSEREKPAPVVAPPPPPPAPEPVPEPEPEPTPPPPEPTTEPEPEPTPEPTPEPVSEQTQAAVTETPETLPEALPENKHKDIWLEHEAGGSWAAVRSPILALGRPLNVDGEGGTQEMYVALWYKHGKPCSGAVWPDAAGKISAEFVSHGAVHTKYEQVRTLQILVYDERYAGYKLSWQPYRVAYVDRASGWWAVRVDDTAPCVVTHAGGRERLGKVQLREERASIAGADGKPLRFDGPQVQDFMVLCRDSPVPGAIYD